MPLELDTSATHRLGTRAFLLIMAMKSRLVVFTGALLLIWWLFGDKVIPKAYVIYVDYAFLIALLAWVGLFVFMFLYAFFEYRSQRYRFDDEFFHISRGYFRKSEVGVVYHQIQTITLERSLPARFVGTAHLLIVMTGDMGENQEQAHLAAIDVHKARLIQKELLRRARPQQQQMSQQPQGAYWDPPLDQDLE